MKYIYIPLSLVLFFSCNQQKVKNLEKELQQVKKQNELIRDQSNQKDNFIEEYTGTLNDVYDNLEIIRKREGLITAYSKNLENKQKIGVREKMLTDIKSIDNYITTSKSKLLRLQNRYRKVSVNSKSFENTIEKLTKELDEREKYIKELRLQIDDLSQQVTSTNAELQVKNELIEAQSEKMKMAFMVIGTEDELAAKNIISYKGGILGFGQTIVVSPKLNSADFTPLDMMEMDSITIPAKTADVQVVSIHDPQSYSLTPDSTRQATIFQISEPETFWRSRYLVIIAPRKPVIDK